MKSDNLIPMREIPATEAARKFSEVLDAVEHRGEEFAIRRHGKVVAKLVPVARSNGAAVIELLTANPPDSDWWNEIKKTRELLIDPVITWEE